MVGEARLQRDVRERLRNFRSVTAQPLQLPPCGQNPLFAASLPEQRRPSRAQCSPPEHEQPGRRRQQQHEQPYRAARVIPCRRAVRGAPRFRFAACPRGVGRQHVRRLLSRRFPVRRLSRSLRRLRAVRLCRRFRFKVVRRLFFRFGCRLGRGFGRRFGGRRRSRHWRAASHLHGHPAKAVEIDLRPRVRILIGHARPLARFRVHQIAAHIPGRYAERLQHGGGGAGKVHAVAAMALGQKIPDKIRAVGRALGLKIIIARLTDIGRHPADDLRARHGAVDSG